MKRLQENCGFWLLEIPTHCCTVCLVTYLCMLWGTGTPLLQSVHARVNLPDVRLLVIHSTHTCYGHQFGRRRQLLHFHVGCQQADSRRAEQETMHTFYKCYKYTQACATHFEPNPQCSMHSCEKIRVKPTHHFRSNALTMGHFTGAPPSAPISIFVCSSMHRGKQQS